MKPWNKHSSEWCPNFEDRPEQTFELDEPKDVLKLPIELFYSVIGCSVFAGFILFLFSKALV